MSVRGAGLKRVELAVSLTALALLALVLIPVVRNAVWTSNASQCGQRAKDVFVALTAANVEREALVGGSLPAGDQPFPDGSFSNSTAFFQDRIERLRLPGLAYTSLACSGVPVCQDGKLKPENNMWTIIKEWRDEMEDLVPVMCTRNLDASSFSFNGAVTPLRFDPEWKTPFGTRGCVIVRKGGAIFRAREKYVTNRVLLNAGAPWKVVRAHYLTPSKEVVAGE